MKKLLSIIGFLFGGALLAFAQDVITTADGTEIMAKVLEVTTSEVKYKKFNNPDGPVFTLSKSDILLVQYENGENEVFSNNKSNGYQPNTQNQVYAGMKYREYKDFYDTHLYVPQPYDTYNRFWSGFASFIIPGLGQAFEGEWGRAAGFLLANIGLYALALCDSTTETTTEGSMTIYTIQYGTFGRIVNWARFGLNIWSLVDAVHVAKVKNMYYQDLRGQNAMLNFDLEPYFALTPSGVENGMVPAAGLSLKLCF